MSGAAINLRGVAVTKQLARLAIEGEFLTGLSRSFILSVHKSRKRIQSKDFFSFYIDNIERLLEEKGVLLLKDIESSGFFHSLVAEETELNKKIKRKKRREKSYEIIKHDLLLWEYAVRKRASLNNSTQLFGNGFWVLTLDYHFLGMDARRRRAIKMNPPICLIPPTLMQMLKRI